MNRRELFAPLLGLLVSPQILFAKEESALGYVARTIRRHERTHGRPTWMAIPSTIFDRLASEIPAHYRCSKVSGHENIMIFGTEIRRLT